MPCAAPNPRPSDKTVALDSPRAKSAPEPQRQIRSENSRRMRFRTCTVEGVTLELGAARLGRSELEANTPLPRLARSNDAASFEVAMAASEIEMPNESRLAERAHRVRPARSGLALPRSTN